MTLFINLVSIFFLVIRYLYFKDYFISALGLAFTFWVFLRFIDALGRRFPLKELILLIASSQWILGAKIAYLQGMVHHRYYMYVEEEAYMNFVVIASLLFAAGLFLIKIPINFKALWFKDQFDKQKALKHASIILFIGLLSLGIQNLITIPGLGFVLYLLNLLIYVSAAYFMVIYPDKRYVTYFLVVLYALIKSLLIALFHELFLVGALLLFFLFSADTKFVSKLLFIVISGTFIFAIQTVKKDYRTFAWSGVNKADSGEVLYELLLNEFANTSSSNANYLNQQEGEVARNAEVNNRLNQGWIISRTMSNIPKNKSYLFGESIVKSIEASVLPRLLAPNKAGGECAIELFQEVTGLKLNKNTSMGLSVVGEFYANYGVFGGIIAMFIYGLTLAMVIKFVCLRGGGGSPLIFCWFVMFFFQTVKAENNFITVFNHLVKALVIFYILKLILYQYGIDLFNSLKSKANLSAPIIFVS